MGGHGGVGFCGGLFSLPGGGLIFLGGALTALFLSPFFLFFFSLCCSSIHFFASFHLPPPNFTPSIQGPPHGRPRPAAPRHPGVTPPPPIPQHFTWEGGRDPHSREGNPRLGGRSPTSRGNPTSVGQPHKQPPLPPPSPRPLLASDPELFLLPTAACPPPSPHPPPKNRPHKMGGGWEDFLGGIKGVLGAGCTAGFVQYKGLLPLPLPVL